MLVNYTINDLVKPGDGDSFDVKLNLPFSTPAPKAAMEVDKPEKDTTMEDVEAPKDNVALTGENSWKTTTQHDDES